MHTYGELYMIIHLEESVKTRIRDKRPTSPPTDATLNEYYQNIYIYNSEKPFSYDSGKRIIGQTIVSVDNPHLN